MKLNVKKLNAFYASPAYTRELKTLVYQCVERFTFPNDNCVAGAEPQSPYITNVLKDLGLIIEIND